MLAFASAALLVLPNAATAQTLSLTTTSDFDAGTKGQPGDGNFGVETRTDDPSVVEGQLELASLKGDAFSFADPDANTFKWDLEAFCTVRGPTTIIREISSGRLRLGAQKATGSSRVGAVMSSSLSGDIDVRVKVDEVATDPSAQFELLIFNEKRCYAGISPRTADGVFYTWDEGPVDGSFLLKAVMVTNSQETNCGTATTVTSVDPVFLRITRTADTWSWWYSADGFAWTQDKVCTLVVAGNLYAALMTKDSKGGITSTFEADDFEVAGGLLDPGGYRTAGDWTSPSFDVPSGFALNRVEIGGSFDSTFALDRTELRRGGTVLETFEADNTFVVVPSNRVCGGNLDVRLYLKGSGAGTPVVSQVDVFHETFTTTLEDIVLGSSTGTENQCASDDIRDTKTEALGSTISEHLVSSESLLTGIVVGGNGPPAPSDTDASDDVSVGYREAAVPSFADAAPDSQTLTSADHDSGSFPACAASDDDSSCTWSEVGSTTSSDYGPATRSVLVGTESGTFPDGLSLSDDSYLEYDEVEGPTVTQDYFPSTQTVVKGVEGTPPAFKQGRFVRKTDGTGLQAVTGVGFEGRALILWWTRQTTLGTISPGNFAGIGLVASASQQYAIAWGDDDNVNPTNSGRRSAAAAISILNGGAPTVDGEARFVAFTPDGFELDWTANPSPAQATIIHYAVLGEVVTDAFVGEFTGPAAGVLGNRAYTRVGFRGDAALFMSTLQTGLGSAPVANFGFGAATGPTNRVTATVASPDNGTTAVRSSHDQKALVVYNGSLSTPASDQVMDFVSFDANGFTLNHQKATTGNVKFYALVLKGGSYKANYLTRPSAVGDQPITGLGFHPSGVLFFGMSGSIAFGGTDTGGEFVLGAGSQTPAGSTEDLIWAGSNDAVSPSNTNMHTSQTRVIIDISLSSGGLQNEADYKSSNSDGFTLTWTRIQSSTTQRWLYFAIGGGGGGGGPTPTCTGPTEFDSTGNLGENLNDNSRTTFRNPRGLQRRYVVYKDTSQNDLVYRWSADGCSWSGETVISGTTPNNFDLTIHDTGADLKVFLVVVEGTSIKYRRGTIADALDSITWDPEMTIVTVTKNLGRAHSATIVRTTAGRLAVAYTTDAGSYRTTRLIGSNADGAAPVWSGDILWDTPSGSSNNANKDKVLFTLAPFSAAFPDRFVMVAIVPDAVDSTHYRQVSDSPDWNGVAFTAPAKTVIQGGVDGPDAISCVVDDGDRAHCLVEEASNLWTVHAATSGADDWTGRVLAVPPENESGRSTLAIDRSSTPDVLYLIYDKSLVNLDLFYKTSPVTAISWSGENRIVYGEDIRDVGSGLRDYVGGIHVIGDRATNVMFYHEIRLTAPPPPPPEPGTSAFPECVALSDDSSCLYTETEQGSGGPFQVEVRYGWTGVDTTGDAWNLVVEGRLGGSNTESVDVYFLGSDEVTRTLGTCSILSIVDAVYECGALTVDQLDGGSPDVVFVDAVQATDGLASSFHLDQVYIVRSFTGKALEVQVLWSGLAAGAASSELRVEGHVTDEPIEVQVFTSPGTWTTRLTLSSGVDTTLSYVLTSAEFNAGAPAIRLRDTDSSEPVASSLRLDRVWIVRSEVSYDLSLEWDWAGVAASAVSLLEIRASRGGDSEVLVAEVYDWQDLAWRSAATISASTETAYETGLSTGCSAVTLGDCEISFSGDVRVRFRTVGGPDPTETTLVVDLGVVRVSDEAHALDLVYAWSLGTRSGEDRLFVEGRRSDETILVSAWNWIASGWESAGSIASGTDVTIQHVLTDAQVSSTFEVRIRFVGNDETAADAIASELYLDHVAISKREYRLNVVNTISGIVGDGPFVLRLEGRLASSGENVDVYVWDVAFADWTLWLNSPFTTTDQIFERTLAASEVSGLGEVRIRYLDTFVVGDSASTELEVDLLEVVDAP